jgi:membrane protease YdiL (CAAX protease family)
VARQAPESHPASNRGAPSGWARLRSSLVFRFLVLLALGIAGAKLTQLAFALVLGLKARVVDQLSTAQIRALIHSHEPGHTIADVPAGALFGAAAIAFMCIAIFISLWVYSKVSGSLEQRTVTEFSGPHRLRRLLAGAAVGAGIICGAIGIQVWLGDAELMRDDAFALSGRTLLPVLMAPVFEELIFRGTALRLLEQRWGSAVALAITSALFGVAHLMNPNSNVLSAVCVAIEAGLLLGIAYIATRSLWLPIGLHFGWNFAEGDILGCPDSGVAVSGVFHTSTHGNALITGGEFGPEGSLISPVLCLVVTMLLYRVAVAGGQWKAFGDHRDQ